MRIERFWSMPNSNTFQIAPIRERIQLWRKHVKGTWIDPYANKNHLADITNDLNPAFNTDFHLDAFDFLKSFEDNSVTGVLFDPPYSPRQVAECYHGVGKDCTMTDTDASFWSKQKEQIGRIVKPGGVVMTFGWNSGGIGRKYGFNIEEIVLVAHGGWHNDTIMTIERKRNEQGVLW